MSVTTKSCSNCFKTLSEPTRIMLVKHLQRRELNVSKLTEYLGLTQPTVSHHLKLLDRLGIVKKVKRGRATYYSFNTNYPCKGCGVFSASIRT